MRTVYRFQICRIAPFIDGRGLPMPPSWVNFWLLTNERGGADARFQTAHRPLDSYEAVRLDIAVHKTMTTVPASVARATTDLSVRAVPIDNLDCAIAIGSRASDSSPLVRDFRDVASWTAADLIRLVPGGRLPDR